MPDPNRLSEKNRAKLDGIVQEMISNNESDDNIQFVVNDFKQKYAEKKNPIPNGASSLDGGSSDSQNAKGFPKIDQNGILPNFEEMDTNNPVANKQQEQPKMATLNKDRFQKAMQKEASVPKDMSGKNRLLREDKNVTESKKRDYNSNYERALREENKRDYWMGIIAKSRDEIDDNITETNLQTEKEQSGVLNNLGKVGKFLWNNTTGAMLSETNTAFGGTEDYFKIDDYKPLQDQQKKYIEKAKEHNTNAKPEDRLPLTPEAIQKGAEDIFREEDKLEQLKARIDANTPFGFNNEGVFKELKLENIKKNDALKQAINVASVYRSGIDNFNKYAAYINRLPKEQLTQAKVDKYNDYLENAKVSQKGLEHLDTTFPKLLKEVKTSKEILELTKYNYNDLEKHFASLKNITLGIVAGTAKFALETADYLNQQVNQIEQGFETGDNEIKPNIVERLVGDAMGAAKDGIDDVLDDAREEQETFYHYKAKNINNLSDAGSYVAQFFSEQAPIYATLIAAPEAGIYLLGAGSAGQKFSDMEYEETLPGARITSFDQKFWTSTLYGTAEGAFGGLGTAGIIKRMQKTIARASTGQRKLFYDGVLKENVKGLGRLGLNTGIETATEEATAITQVVADRYIAGKEISNQEANEIYFESGFGGALGGGVMSTFGGVGGALAQKAHLYSENKDIQDTKKILAQIDVFSQELKNNPNLTVDDKKIIYKQIENLTNKSFEIVIKNAKKGKNFSAKENQFLVDINVKQDELKQKFEKLKNSNISKEQKQLLTTELNNEFNQLEKDRNGTLKGEFASIPDDRKTITFEKREEEDSLKDDETPTSDFTTLSTQEQTKLKDQAARELIKEKNPDGKEGNFTVTDEEITQRAVENFNKANEQQTTPTPEAQPQAEAEKVDIADIDRKRKETEAKIKRKDLFSAGGSFSNQLGESGVDSVPTNHTEINGVEFVEFSNPNTGTVDVVMSGTSDKDFVGYYRIYENGKPTDKWSSKFENQSRNKENFKTMIGGVQSMLPDGHQYTETTSISTDGLRIWEQQLSRGYELQYDDKGNLITNEVAINGDAIVNELGIDVNQGNFDNISVTNNQQFQSVKKALLPYLQKLGLNESNIRNVNGTVEIDLPVLRKKKTNKPSPAEDTATPQEISDLEFLDEVLPDDVPNNQSDIEAKKADIEKRRQEELNKYNSEKNKFNKDDGKGDYVITAEGNLYIDEINAKYDAELKALEEQSNNSQINNPNNSEGSEQITTNNQNPNQINNNSPKEPTLNPITDQEFLDFVENDFLSDERLTDVATKVRENKDLNAYEKRIAKEKTKEIFDINKKVEEVAAETKRKEDVNTLSQIPAMEKDEFLQYTNTEKATEERLNAIAYKNANNVELNNFEKRVYQDNKKVVDKINKGKNLKENILDKIPAEQKYQTQEGKYTVAKNENGLELYDNNGQPALTPKTKQKYFLEALENGFMKRNEDLQYPDGITEAEAERFELENETDPSVILEKLLKADPKVDGSIASDVKEYAIALYITKVTQKSFVSFSDKNNITKSIALSYFSKDGREIDDLAQEISSEMGVQVEPQDVVDFILANPNGKRNILTVKNPTHQKLIDKFVELTGFRPTPSQIAYFKLNKEVTPTQIDFEFANEVEVNDEIDNDIIDKVQAQEEFDNWFSSLTPQEKAEFYFDLEQDYPNAYYQQRYNEQQEYEQSEQQPTTATRAETPNKQGENKPDGSVGKNPQQDRPRSGNDNLSERSGRETQTENKPTGNPDTGSQRGREQGVEPNPLQVLDEVEEKPTENKEEKQVETSVEIDDNGKIVVPIESYQKQIIELNDEIKQLEEKLNKTNLNTQAKIYKNLQEKIVAKKLRTKTLTDIVKSKETSTPEPKPNSGTRFSLSDDKQNPYTEVINGFYSPLEKIINETKFDKLPAKQWIDKFAKGEEAKWTGLTEWLSQQQVAVSKAEIQQYLKENRIEVKEVVKGKRRESEKQKAIQDLKDLGITVGEFPDGTNFYNEDGDIIEIEDFNEKQKEAGKRYYSAKLDTTDDTKFSQYQLEGDKENYKEVLVTMPQKKTEKPYKQWLKENFYGEDRKEARDLYAQQISSKDPNFKSSHFEEPNILVHLRMNTRTDAEGNKVLFLEEVQSDYGQSYKKDTDAVIDYVDKNKEKVIEAFKKKGILNIICP